MRSCFRLDSAGARHCRSKAPALGPLRPSRIPGRARTAWRRTRAHFPAIADVYSSLPIYLLHQVQHRPGDILFYGANRYAELFRNFPLRPAFQATEQKHRSGAFAKFLQSRDNNRQFFFTDKNALGVGSITSTVEKRPNIAVCRPCEPLPNLRPTAAIALQVARDGEGIGIVLLRVG